MLRRLTAALFTLLLCLPLCSCGRASPLTALSVLMAMTRTEQAAPSGDVYLLPDSTSLRLLNQTDGAPPTVRIADKALLDAAFATGADGEAWQCDPSIVEDGAMRLSTAASPCEWVVLRCVSRTDTDAVADMLLHRLALIRRQYRVSELETLSERAEVVILGKFVVLVVAHDPEGAIDAARRALT